MRVGLIADVHLGNHRRFGGPLEAGLNRRCRQAVAALRNAAEEAGRQKCDALVVAGDLFDSARPEPQVIAAAMRALRAGPPALVLKGNHDSVSDAPGDNALGPLTQGMFDVFERPARVPGAGVDLLLVPFRAGDAREWLPSAVDEALGKIKVPRRRVELALFVHLGIADDDTPEWLRGSRDSVDVSTLEKLCAERGISFVGAGNWHNPESWQMDGGGQIVQVGALCPTGFDNEGLDCGSLAVWDSETGEVARHEIPGPRFLRLNVGWASAEAARLATKAGHGVYAEIVHSPDLAAEAATRLRTLIDEGSLIDGELRPDGDVAEAAARSAAAAVRGADTLDAALAGYVGEMQLEDGVVRTAVLERAKKYLAAAEER